MPNLPSSFASAAAGQNANRDVRGNRGDSRGGGGDWTRREGRANGTLTFRRTSTTPGQSSQSAHPSEQTLQANASNAESTSAAVGSSVASEDFAPQSTTYPKQTILDIFRDMPAETDSSDIREPGWVPGQVNGNSSRGRGKSGHVQPNQDPNSCWIPAATNSPVSSRSLTAEEKETLASDVNSPLKPPNQKDGNAQGGGGAVNGRKASLSHGAGSAFGLTSPTSASRPGTRRRETIDSNPFTTGGLSSPASTGRFPRDDPGFLLGRRGTEQKEQEGEEEGGAPTRETPARETPVPQSRPGFGSLSRINTTGTMGGSNISSLWGQTASAQPQPSSAVGSFGQFSLATPTSLSSATRGGSRFANLIPKEGSEGMAGKSGESAAATTNPDLSLPWRPRPRTDTDPFGDDGPSGSAALGGAKDTSPPPMPNYIANIGVFETPVKGSAGDFGMSGLTVGDLGGHGGHQGDHHDQGPVSPSETNPYRSPPAAADRGDEEHDDPGEKRQGSAAGSEQASTFGTLSRGFPSHNPHAHAAFDGSDRSQTSSAGPKGYPSLSGLSGWPAPGPSGTTPDRERQSFASAFGNSFFSPMGGDVQQSPGLSMGGGGVGGVGGIFGPPSAGPIGGTGSMGRSKLGSLFPAAMQAQMHAHDQQQQQHDHLSDSLPDVRQAQGHNPVAPIGRNTFTPQHRDTGSPMRAGRGAFDDLFSPPGDHRALNMFGSAAPDTSHHGATPGAQTPSYPGPSSSADLPTSQVRQMVMPDRMRWVYLDPQGQVQGPFTGLEMNDWYKANFFTADLRVKKVEDPEFEPLGQLIRRIGNSREPFLVPQIGVAHGPPPNQPGPFSAGTPGGVIPPLSGVFPSYGRTLTAEEQNNLERRKQEEQFAMAQQRELMMRQQAIGRMQPGAGLQTSLHHHSSTHSLQNQASFGSISSPIGGSHQQVPVSAGGMAPGAPFFDGVVAPPSGSRGPLGPSLDAFREDDLATLNATERQMLANVQGGASGSFFPPQPIGPAGNEGQLRSNLPGTEQLADDEEGFRERLQEFEKFRAEHEREVEQEAQVDDDNNNNIGASQLSGREKKDDTTSTTAGAHTQSQKEEAQAQGHQHQHQSEQDNNNTTRMLLEKARETQLLSLTQQVQQTQAAAAAAAAGLPMPFPPPPSQSGTPLPAPTAQRIRSNLPEQYSRSQSGTPDASSGSEPPPLAPWAKDSGSGSRKGPSLKEIQEIEARNAAKAEEAATAARRAQLEQEAALLREREKVAASTPGLPTTSTWGSASPVPVGSPWAKPSAVKVAPGAASTTKHKTLADIQREEEARKEKARAAAAQSGAVPINTVGAKRYADLAPRSGGGAGSGSGSNNSNPPGFPQVPSGVPAAVGSGWATVGAGGKVKAPPTGPAAQTPSRTVSINNGKAATPVKAISKPAMSTPGTGSKTDAAMDEFSKWLHRELSRGITGVDIETFAATLVILPLDPTLIADAVYANSKTMNGQHFAEEFVRRKRRAEQGIVEKQPGGGESNGGTGGWNEVAKKGSHRESATSEAAIQGAGFKVVPGRKKGGKKN
ncbi:hypothetical protein SODALDRAFT_286865 [Sodiomyces alkalinus F11]|uniref:GYF domain-containing protein n=1 Tax=Sodiomyces alkalinus (strain CBS 110278 / VKM F-3762 / F11) TaxID=1314773 RepID=A0A3N2Q588_SODAK|nr:hypothetical protein SODALDRAFT_286865 [Sodiomyces alkalinus F11]ROT41922.1 hypothetical protein SODALDRAFT_286865 [Sodiomyces alkalinus F11]